MFDAYTDDAGQVIWTKKFWLWNESGWLQIYKLLFENISAMTLNTVKGQLKLLQL